MTHRLSIPYASPLFTAGQSMLMKGAISLGLLECLVCKYKLESITTAHTFPLCGICAQSLIKAPTLCSSCASVQCLPTHCLRPWRTHNHPIRNDAHLSQNIQGYTARYLLIGQGYLVLKKWKTHGGPLFDQLILNQTSELQNQWSKINPHFIVPIPQSFNRSLALRGGSSVRIATWLSQILNTPMMRALDLTDQAPKNQASLNQQARMSLENHFKASDPLTRAWQQCKNARVILVDDFMTTGKTVQKASQVLFAMGVSQIDVFVLGVRPALGQKKRR